MRKLNRLIILCFVLVFTPMATRAQCKFDHTFKIEHSVKEGSGGKILIGSGESKVEFKLYSEVQGVITLIETKVISFKNNKSPVPVFDSLKPGKYHVLAEWNGCKSGVGGLEGITIN
jgi:hypothetical protein